METIETVRELINQLRELESKPIPDKSSQKKIFQKFEIIAETLEKKQPTIRIETVEKKFSGECVRMKLKGKVLYFTLKDSKNWRRKTKIPEELIDIFPWVDRDKKPLFWKDLFREKEEEPVDPYFP